MGGSSKLCGKKGVESTIMRLLRKGTSNTKRLAYMSLVRPILEYGAACWDPYRGVQIRELDRLQKKAAEFALTQIVPNGKHWHRARR